MYFCTVNGNKCAYQYNTIRSTYESDNDNNMHVKTDQANDQRVSWLNAAGPLLWSVSVTHFVSRYTLLSPPN